MTEPGPSSRSSSIRKRPSSHQCGASTSSAYSHSKNADQILSDHSPKRKRVRPTSCVCSSHLHKRHGVPTLLDLAARITAQHVPFQVMEDRFQRIPEPVQHRVLFWSFPREEKRIRMYSSPYSQSEHQEDKECPSAFTEGTKLLEKSCVEDALQIGFHLSGCVRPYSVALDPATSSRDHPHFRVSVSFDRCKITAVKCSCSTGGTTGIHWCAHVVALSLFRIRHAENVQLRLPISETLHSMDRDQLQKLVQYLVSEHYTQVLPTTQKIADDLLQPSSSINQIAGAPDPTAGPCVDSEHSWYLNEDQVKSVVKGFLTSQTNGGEQIVLLFGKVREMLKRKDGNGPRLLQMLTQQFLMHKNPYATATHLQPVLSEKMQQMWDQLGALWVCVVLNPHASAECKRRWADILGDWVSQPICPPEIGTVTVLDAVLYGGGAGSNDNSPRRTVFSRALDACQIDWSDSHLRNIMEERYASSKAKEATLKTNRKHSDVTQFFNVHGQPLWTEHFPTACARVDSLRAHGCKRQSLALAVAIARAVKQTQNNAAIAQQVSAPEGWIGHPLDPINCLFDTLITVGAKRKAEQQSNSSSTRVGQFSTAVSAHSRKPSDSIDHYESCATLALETAVIALGQKRLRPNCAYAKCKSVKQEKCLVTKIKTLQLDENFMTVIKRQALFLLDGQWSGLSGCLLTQPAPVHTVACFLFESLLLKDANLAYNVGLTALRTPVSDVPERDDGAFLMSHPIAWSTITFDYCEHQQSELARTMLLSSKDDVNKLRKVLEAIHGYMRSSSLVCRLAHEIHQAATSYAEGTLARQNLLNTALELGLQVLRMTVGSPTWWPRREMVRWLVNCASSLSLAALLSVLHNWQQLFTPAEAAGTVAQLILADTVALQLKLNAKDQEQLITSIHHVALQCAVKDPSNCALHALMLCETSATMFDHCYAVVETRSAHSMPAQELYNIARYMEQRAHTDKAYQMAVLGLAKTHIGYGDEANPLIQDVYWACWLADRLERRTSNADNNIDDRAQKNAFTSPLAGVIMWIIKNVKSASVLSAILRGYALGAAGFSSPGWLDEQKGTSSSSGGSRQSGCKKAKTDNNYGDVPFDKPPLNGLLEAALDSYRQTAEGRLHHISPRHYSEFLDFLAKAKDTFLMAPGGNKRFERLLIAMKQRFKGKKKLMAQISYRFNV